MYLFSDLDLSVATFGDHTYHISMINYNYTDAEQYCSDRFPGGYLAVPDSQLEMDFLTEYVIS